MKPTCDWIIDTAWEKCIPRKRNKEPDKKNVETSQSLKSKENNKLRHKKIAHEN
jgi:hypothetical protein